MLSIYLCLLALYYAAFLRFDATRLVSIVWDPRPGLSIVLEWAYHGDVAAVRLVQWVSAFCLLMLGLGVLIDGIVVRIYIVTELVQAIPSIAYLIFMIVAQGGHAVPSILQLLFQSFLLLCFSVAPVAWGIVLIAKTTRVLEK